MEKRGENGPKRNLYSPKFLVFLQSMGGWSKKVFGGGGRGGRSEDWTCQPNVECDPVETICVIKMYTN